MAPDFLIKTILKAKQAIQQIFILNLDLFEFFEKTKYFSHITYRNHSIIFFNSIPDVKAWLKDISLSFKG